MPNKKRDWLFIISIILIIFSIIFLIASYLITNNRFFIEIPLLFVILSLIFLISTKISLLQIIFKKFKFRESSWENIKQTLFFIIVIYIFYRILTYNTVQDLDNGLRFFLISLLATISLFIINELNKSLKESENQEDVLKQLIQDIKYLVNDENGSIKFFMDAVSLDGRSKKGYPNHPIQNLNINYYLINIKHRFNFKDTEDIKFELKRIYDKIAMLNYYQSSEEIWNKQRKKKGQRIEERNGYLREVLEELKNKLDSLKVKIYKEYSL